MGRIQTGVVEPEALGRTLHGIDSCHTVMACCGDHGEIARQFDGVLQREAVELVEVVSVDIAISVGVVAYGSIGCVVVTLAVAFPFGTLTYLLAVTIAMHWQFASVGSQVQVVQSLPSARLGVHQTPTLRFTQTAALQQRVDHRFLGRNMDATVLLHLTADACLNAYRHPHFREGRLCT